MSNPAAATLIAERLPSGLIHPGDPANNQPAKLIPLPGLSNLGMSPEQAAHFANEAGLPENDAPKLVAEAILHLIETELDGGSEIIPKAELAQLRAEAATLDDTPTGTTVQIYCRCNRDKPLLELTIGRPMVLTSGSALRQRINEVCTCQ